MLRTDARAPGLLVGDGVQIGEGVRLGAYVVLHDGTRLAEGCVVEDHAVLGRRPRRASGGGPESLTIGAGVSVGVGAIVFAGASVAEEAVLGDQSYVRERSRIGAGTLIGRGAVVESDVVVGARVSVQTGASLTAFSEVEDDVFVGPGAITTNDDTMGRHPPGRPLRGPTLRRACRIGGGSVLVPGVEIGEEAFVAAGAVVVADVPPRAVVMGVPARVVRDVPEDDLLERWR